MPRQAREKSPVGMYHIMFRGNNKQTIFEDDEDRKKFLGLLYDLPKQYTPHGDLLPSVNCILYAFCLMSNHVHLLYREMNEEVNHTMKRLLTSYAQYYNKKYGRVGHLFQDRFKSEPCNDMEYFVTLLRYIHQNPIKADIVQNLDEYPWSSWHEYTKSSDVEYRICNTIATLKRLPLDYFVELMYDRLPDDIGCIEDDQDVCRRHSDNEVKAMMEGRWGICNHSDFQNQEQKRQSELIVALYESGASFNQIARLTGKSYRQVYKAVKQK